MLVCFRLTGSRVKHHLERNAFRNLSYFCTLCAKKNSGVNTLRICTQIHPQLIRSFPSSCCSDQTLPDCNIRKLSFTACPSSPSLNDKNVSYYSNGMFPVKETLRRWVWVCQSILMKGFVWKRTKSYVLIFVHYPTNIQWQSDQCTCAIPAVKMASIRFSYWTHPFPSEIMSELAFFMHFS